MASRANASAFYTILLYLRSSPPVVAPFAATRSFVSGIARSIHTDDEETVKPFTTAGHYHSFSSSAAPNDHTCSQSSRGKVLQSTSIARMRHPLMTQGLTTMCNVEEYEREAIMKVDMPGIGKEGLNIEVKNNSIHIEGKAEKECEDDEDTLEITEPNFGGDLPPGFTGALRRIYTGIVDLPPGFYNTDQITASMKLGVLKVIIPKLKPQEMTDSSLVPPPIKFRPH